MGIKYQVNENFFNKWSPEMAYVLGYLYADGSLEDASYLRGKYVRVSSIDKSTIIKIKKWLESEHKIVILKPDKNSGSKNRYFLRIGSHALYDSLIKLGLYPNKSLTVKFPDIPNKFLSHFIRGYFDGDGCVNLYTAEGVRQKIITKKLSAIFSSGSFDFLEKLGNIMKKNLGLVHNKVYKSQRSFQLRYSTNDSIKIFEHMYCNCKRENCLERKFEIFKKYFKLQSRKISKKIDIILNNMAS